MALHVSSAAWHSMAIAGWSQPSMECIFNNHARAKTVLLCVFGSVSSIGIDKGNDECTGMLIIFDALTMAQKQLQRQKPRQWQCKLVPFVVLAMVKASAAAKDVVSLLVCTMAKTLVNSASMHDQTFFQQPLAAEANKLKQRAAVACGIQQHVAAASIGAAFITQKENQQY